MRLAKGVLRIPSSHRTLVKLHEDLFRIHRKVSQRTFQTLSNAEMMVVLLEDRRFFHHRGIDFKSVIREVCRALMLQKHGGASTIDMQFVRTATGYRNRTLLRKLYEIVLSLLIQFRYDKITILRSYMDHAFFGSKLIGLDAVASEMFQKSARDLDLEEAAFIAAMLVSPKPLVPQEAWFNRVNRRAVYARNLLNRYKERFDKVPASE